MTVIEEALSYVVYGALRSVIYPSKYIEYLLELDERIVDLPLTTINYLDSCLKRLGISLISTMSEEQKEILIKRGAFIVSSDEGEELYRPEDVIYRYEDINQDLSDYEDAMKIMGADDESIDLELANMVSYLKTRVFNEGDTPKPCFTEEQYKRALAYLEAEKFVDNLQESISMSAMERINIISDICDYTLSLDDSSNPLEVSEKMLSIVNKRA